MVHYFRFERFGTGYVSACFCGWDEGGLHSDIAAAATAYGDHRVQVVLDELAEQARNVRDSFK